jgi:hypothetical protein
LNTAENGPCREFRNELRDLQSAIREFARTLAHLAGAGFGNDSVVEFAIEE